MRAVVQRVKKAEVTINGEVAGSIGRGLMILLGVECGDTEKDAGYIVKKCLNLRIFRDENDKMNLSVLDTGGSILLISQFTLLGDAKKGNRPSFIEAEIPEKAIPLYEFTIAEMRKQIRVETGVFGADMDVSLVNEGPVTILLDSRKTF